MDAVLLSGITAWYVVMSGVSVVMYWRDKHAAQRSEWRVPERMLHLIALLGGWPGALAAQRWFRHKTRKRGFRLVTMLIVVAHLALWIVALVRWAGPL